MKRSRIGPGDPERKAARFRRNFGSRAYLEALKAEGCLVWRRASKYGRQFALATNCHDKLDAAHAIAVGKGGAKGDCSHVVILCRALIHRMPRHGITVVPHRVWSAGRQTVKHHRGHHNREQVLATEVNKLRGVNKSLEALLEAAKDDLAEATSG